MIRSTIIKVILSRLPLSPKIPYLPFLSVWPSTKPQYAFSTEQQLSKIKKILESIPISIQNQQKNILSSGLITDYKYDPINNKILVEISTGKDFAKLRHIIKTQLSNHHYDNVQIILKQKTQKKIFDRKGNLSAIKKIIAVASCKGGVGKSTIAVNIAWQLQEQGFNVGVFDADIYGPSLPTLIKKQGQVIKSKEGNQRCLIPIEVSGIKCVSFGFLGNKPAVFRGPMASSIVSQMLLQTQWGHLDYLIVDMPPGTGDINLTVCQQLKFDGAIIVSTPQRLSFIDVVKGIQMFQNLRVRILGVVQNMSYYLCGKCGIIDEVFGKGHSKIIVEQFGIENLFRIPIVAELNGNLDTPAGNCLPKDHMIKQIYAHICSSIIKQLQKQLPKTVVYYNTGQRMLTIQQSQKKIKIKPLILRLSCKCHQCVNEITGERQVTEKQIDPEVYPVTIEEKGNYAVGISWSDGHRNSVYSFKRLFSEEIQKQ